MPPSEIRGSFPDLRELQRDLESVELGLGRLIGEVAREKLGPVIGEIQALLPFDPSHRGWRGNHKRADPGHIRDSPKGTVTGNSLRIQSAHPGAGVQWWSGTIAPRGTTITIERRPGAGADFTSRKAKEVERDLQQAYDRLAREHGL